MGGHQFSPTVELMMLGAYVKLFVGSQNSVQSPWPAIFELLIYPVR